MFDEAEGERVDICWEELVNGLGLAPGTIYPIRPKVLDDDYEWSAGYLAGSRREA